jgi:succinate-semialdehyde dehydrogenase/glutarate-semialdehyde dehydrogenase
MTQLKDKQLLKNACYINGEWVKGDAETLAVNNPANGDLVGTISCVGATQTEIAITSAQQAMKLWQTTAVKDKAAVLRRWYDLQIQHADDLALLMTLEQGKTLAESKAEVLYGASFVEWFAEEAKRIYGDMLNLPFNDRRGIVIRQPVGVVAAITPWNFPNAMITRKVAPAIAAGCSIVLKPAAETPLSALALAELADRAGFPKGLFNVVIGKSSEIGQVMTSSPIVRKLTFTGSTPVGKLLMKQCADTVKRTSMELGGNAPILVFDDADIDKAVIASAASKFRNSGQTCICANRILVQDSIYDEFLEKFTAHVNTFTLGNGVDTETTHGPLVTEKAVNDVDAMVQDALDKGAKATVGGQRDVQGPCFYQPTVLANVSQDMRVFKEEIFGPVAPIFKFRSEQQAIEMANDTEFGLASYVFTRDIGRVWRVSEAIEYGMVGVNEVGITSEIIPFGGVKESGNGREGSKYGLDDYTELKYICMGGLND